jgi:prepilin-type N-terminal cleavage/methylation domain-containing protein
VAGAGLEPSPFHGESSTVQKNSKHRRRGFTLIELVVVLAILVILAGGLVVKLDILQLRANKGVAASDMGGISRMVQTYTIANNHFPNQFDSLLDTTGAVYASLDPQLRAGPGTTHRKLIKGTDLTSDEANSLGRMGITHVCDVDPAATGFPSDRFAPPYRALGGVGTGQVAILNSTHNPDPAVAAGPGADGDADAIMERYYPAHVDKTTGLTVAAGTPPTGTRVVVFALGPNCTLVGRSGLVQTAPIYANSGDKDLFYARDLVCFEVANDGSRARFLSALGADGDRMDEEIQEYYQIQ